MSKTPKTHTSKATRRRQRAMTQAAEAKVIADRYRAQAAETKQRARHLEQTLADQQLANDALELVAAAAAMRYVVETQGHTYSAVKQHQLQEQLQRLDAAVLELAEAWADELDNEKRPRTLEEALVDQQHAQAAEDEARYGANVLYSYDDAEDA